MDNTQNIMGNERDESWLERTQEKAKTDPYTRAMLKTAMKIIDNKSYEEVFTLLIAFDRYIKGEWALRGLDNFGETPFWRCTFEGKKKNGEGYQKNESERV